MILHSYVEQVMTMCRVQELQLSFFYFMDYLPLMVKATMYSYFNTVRNKIGWLVVLGLTSL